MSQKRHSTQCDRLLALLKSRAPEWVPLPEVMDVAGAQYNARVFELRSLGHVIMNRTQEFDGVRKSWFRLTTKTFPAPRAPQPDPGPATLFGDMSEGVHRDEN